MTYIINNSISTEPIIKFGETVRIKQCTEYQNGDVVAATVHNITTIRELQCQDKKTVLRPLNGFFEPIIIKPDSPSIKIIGRVILEK